MKIGTLVRSIFRKHQDRLYVRSAREEDIDELMEIERKVWSEGMRVTREMLISRIRTFPEGFLCAVENGKILGFVCSEIIYYKDTKKIGFNWYNLTDNGFIAKSHNPKGDSLYGISLSIFSEDSKFIATKLLEGMGKLIIRKRLKEGIFGARIPRYYKYYQKMSPEEYVFKRSNSGLFLDPELSFYWMIGLHPTRVIKDYFDDNESLNYGVLVIWKNPFYKITKILPFLSNLLLVIWRANV